MKTFFTLTTLLATSIVTLLTSTSARADQIKDTKTKMSEVENVIHFFYTDCGRYPTDKEGLSSLMKKPADCKNWGGPYVRELPKDAWGHEFTYKLKKDDAYQIKSLGKDGKTGGLGLDMDISSSDD